MNADSKTSIYDYIVIGAGFAGCVLANRLSRDVNNNVLLLEAGSKKEGLLTDMPAGCGKITEDSRYSWLYDSTPEAQTNNRVHRLPRVKMPGGCSAINGVLYLRGQAQDYDKREASGAKEWGRRR